MHTVDLLVVAHQCLLSTSNQKYTFHELNAFCGSFSISVQTLKRLKLTHRFHKNSTVKARNTY
jgi:hypothetical protein